MATKSVKPSYQPGDRVRMKNNTYSSYKAPKGSIHEVEFVNGNGTVQIYVEAYGAVNVSSSSVEPADLSKEYITSKIKEAEALLKDFKDKLTWMEENKIEVFNENEFKVWQVLTTLDNKKLTKIQKSKIVADLIKQ